MAMAIPSFRPLFELLSPARRREAVGLLLAMIAGACADLVTIGAFVPFLMLLTGGGGGGRLAQLTAGMSLPQAVSLFAGAALVAGVLRLVLTRWSQRFAAAVAHDCAVDIQRRLLLQPYSFHLQQHSSSLIAALAKVDELVWRVLLPLIQGVAALLIAAAIFVALLWFVPLVAGPALVVLALLYGAIALTVRRPLEQASAQVSRQYDARIRLVQDSHGAIRDIILDGSAAVALEEFRRSDRAMAEAQARSATLGAAPRTLVEALGLGLLAVFAASVSRVPGGLVGALPLLGMLALSAQRLLPLLQQIYQSWASLKTSEGILSDVRDLLSLPLPASAEVDEAPLPFARDVRLNGVGFCYPERTRPALAQIDLVIRKGERIALAGRTGSGKSTLADLAMGLLEPTAGTIAVDDAVLDEPLRRRWRRAIAHVPQAVFLSDGSIADNVAFGIPADRRDVGRMARALRMAQLDELVAELPLGVDSPVGERGARLSGGQRQRIALARAIYRDTPLLVLDEATNALDPATEAAVLGALDQLQAEGKTIIIIAHRCSALQGCDHIVWLEDGRISRIETPSAV